MKTRDTRTTDPSRREFVAATGAAGVSLAVLGPALARGEQAQAGAPVDVGARSDFPRDGTVVDTWAKTRKFLVVRDGGRIIALSSICTHKKCVVGPKDALIVCRCHGSRFSLQGRPQKGPAPKPLAHLGIALRDGRIVVDPSKQFDEGQWDDPASFVTVDG